MTITESHSCIIHYHAGNSIEVHPSQDKRVDENGDDVPMGDQDNCDGEELPRQAEHVDGNGNDAGEDISMEDQNDRDGESTHQQVRAHAKQPTGKLRATAFKNSLSMQPQVSLLYLISYSRSLIIFVSHQW